MSKVLVTGVNGFVGAHLTEALVNDGHEVVGVGVVSNIDDALASKLSSFILCDLTNQQEVAGLPLNNIDAVINLAGLASVGKSFDAPDEYMRINTGVLSVMCEEIMKQNLQSNIRMLAISSGALYANDQPMPLTESSKVDSASSPYAASKLAMEKLAYSYSEAGLQCIVARPFNHIGPGQGEGFLLPDLYAQLSQALESGQPVVVGDLTTQRDYTDVRDVVSAYIALITTRKPKNRLYNVCSGKPRSGEEVLQALIEIMGKPIDIEVDSNKFRPSDSPILYGSNERIITDTGWLPTIDFKQTIVDFVKSKAN